MLQQQIDHMMVYGIPYLFQNEVLLSGNVYHVQHGILHIGHIAEKQSENNFFLAL